jgi:hypothetical protein
MKDSDLGIYCVNHKKFYYLESGEVPFPNPIAKLRSTLQQRNLIDFTPESYMDTSNYLVKTIREARANNWEMERIFASTYIKQLFAEREAAATATTSTSAESSWGKKPVAPATETVATDKKQSKKAASAS